MPDAATPAFPGSTADRERGKFRPSGTPRQTTVAVSDDAGLPLTNATDDLLRDILAELKINNAHLALITTEELEAE